MRAHNCGSAPAKKMTLDGQGARVKEARAINAALAKLRQGGVTV